MGDRRSVRSLSTSTYSGIVRLLDLALGARRRGFTACFWRRQRSGRGRAAQIRRPAFRHVAHLGSDTCRTASSQHREAIARSGRRLKAIAAFARSLV